MLIQLHTPKGIIERDTATMTKAELDTLGIPDLTRIKTVLDQDLPVIPALQVRELLRLLAQHLGVWSPA